MRRSTVQYRAFPFKKVPCPSPNHKSFKLNQDRSSLLETKAHLIKDDYYETHVVK
jgi:hypothetical protein